MQFWKLFIGCLIVALCSLPASAADDGTVVVQQGQTLRAIAARHKVSVAQLCQWNALQAPDKIRVGQKLHIRPPEGAAASPAKQRVKQGTHAAQTPPASTVQVRAPEGVPEKVKQDLASVGKTLVHKAAKSIMPGIRSKAVAPGGAGGYTASYMEVDTTDIRTEVLPSAESGKYVGSIRYVEKQYECQGASRAEALQAACHVVKSRRMNELIRYEKGKWHY